MMSGARAASRSAVWNLPVSRPLCMGAVDDHADPVFGAVAEEFSLGIATAAWL
jgi:hypothetical protein